MMVYYAVDVSGTSLLFSKSVAGMGWLPCVLIILIIDLLHLPSIHSNSVWTHVMAAMCLFV